MKTVCSYNIVVYPQKSHSYTKFYSHNKNAFLPLSPLRLISGINTAESNCKQRHYINGICWNRLGRDMSMREYTCFGYISGGEEEVDSVQGRRDPAPKLIQFPVQNSRFWCSWESVVEDGKPDWRNFVVTGCRPRHSLIKTQDESMPTYCYRVTFIPVDGVSLLVSWPTWSEVSQILTNSLCWCLNLN